MAHLCYFTIATFLIVLDLIKVSSLSCSEVKKAGSGSKFSENQLETLSDEDFISCLVYLGREPLGENEGKYMWMRLIELYDNDMWNIPEEDLRQIGWIMKVITPKEIQNLTLADIETISAFGQYHNLSRAQALAEKVREDWNAKDPTDYSFYDLMALNHILCGFNDTDLSVIHPDAYKEAATVLSNLRDCPRQSLEALASLAVSPAAFDEPSTWHSSQVNSVGCVLNGMSRDDITTIPAEGFESLVPDVIECLTKDTLRSMTTYQLKHLTPSAATAITHEQKSLLDFSQQRSISDAQAGEIATKKNQSNGVHSNSMPACPILWILCLVVQ
ncbi:hypothetical protein RUM43_014059 [Polyplax serrata]|uniref:Uncharacterized protein n=1 Tax=Polyplax serrata TaxID=468196 RepID=A0AAN8P568_POLSC